MREREEGKKGEERMREDRDNVIEREGKRGERIRESRDNMRERRRE